MQKVLKVQNLLTYQDTLVKSANKLRKGVYRRNKFAFDGHMANSSIEHINALHSNLKKWMNRFNGAARKYSSNYIKWFKWLQIFDTDKEIIKAKNFIVQSNVIHSYIKVKE